MSQLNPFLNTAFRAVRRSGDFLVRACGTLDSLKVDSKAFYDFVAEVERNVEENIVFALQEAYPQHRVSSKNLGSNGATKSEYEWIVSPLDGVANYARGSSDYVICVALLQKGVLQEALVYAPERNDLYTASRGQGALLNDRRIRVNNRVELKNCVLSSAFTVEQVEIQAALMQRTLGMRSSGASALDLCALACGRNDGFFAVNVDVYALMAAALIVQEAGGIVTDWQGDETWQKGGNIVAANPKVLAQVLKTIGEHA